MAKRKSKNSTASVIKYGAIILGIIGAIMTVFAFVNYGDNSFTGIQVIFGYTGTLGEYITISKQVLNFSVVALIAVVLPIVGSFSVLFKNKLIRLIGALMMLAGTVLCFIIPNFVIFADEITAGIFGAGSLGIGAILAGVMFGIGTLCNLFAVIEK